MQCLSLTKRTEDHEISHTKAGGVVHLVRMWIIVILEVVSQFPQEPTLVVAGFAQRIAEPL